MPFPPQADRRPPPGHFPRSIASRPRCHATEPIHRSDVGASTLDARATELVHYGVVPPALDVGAPTLDAGPLAPGLYPAKVFFNFISNLRIVWIKIEYDRVILNES
jgi:hypothetical protein